VKQLMDGNARYKELDQVAKADQAKLAEMHVLVLTQDTAPKAEDLATLQKRISTSNGEMKELRGKAGFAELYVNRANAEKAWKAAVAASSEAQAAQAAIVTAKKALADAVDTLVASKYPQAVSAAAKDAVQLARLDYAQALNRLELEGANSPISAKVAADAAVVAAQKTLAEKQAALSAGTPDILAARTKAAEAEKKLRAASANAQQSAGVSQVATNTKAQEESNAKREAAQKALTQKRTAAQANIPEASAAQARITEIQAKIKTITEAQRGSEAKKAKDAEASMKAHPDIVAAQNAITKAQESVKAIQDAEPYLGLKKAVSSAQAALKTAAAKSHKGDAALTQLRKDLVKAQTDLQAAEKALNPQTETTPKPEKKADTKKAETPAKDTKAKDAK
jgi:hypothetical protein